jgi:hypothetical protein
MSGRERPQKAAVELRPSPILASSPLEAALHSLQNGE